MLLFESCICIFHILSADHHTHERTSELILLTMRGTVQAFKLALVPTKVRRNVCHCVDLLRENIGLF